MKEIPGRVGAHEIVWLTAPRGLAGKARVRANGRVIELGFRRDAGGLWLEFPDQVRGFDLDGEVSEDGRVRYRVTDRAGSGEWVELCFMRAGEDRAEAAAGTKKKGMRIRAQMPGRVLRVMTEPGKKVTKGQSLLVMEAMKMENEIKAPADAVVLDCKAKEGQTVESGADLILLEPS